MTASRVDSNQPEIVATLRGMGCSVQHLHAVGKGVPDLLVGCRGVNLLVAVYSACGHAVSISHASAATAGTCPLPMALSLSTLAATP